MKSVSRVSVSAALMAVSCFGQNLEEFRRKVTEFTLSNGLHFIVVERHSAPVISLNLQVNAGSVNDPPGRTGLAHMFEHLAYKGTASMGSQGWANEQRALAALKEAETALEQERSKGEAAIAERIDSLTAQVRAASTRADLYAMSGEFPHILEDNGATNLNASTTWESISYTYNLPANRLELAFFMESERLRRPVFREFYKERAVVREERVQRVDSNPQGLLQEAFLKAAFTVHPYGYPQGGSPADLDRLSTADAEKFFQTYYGPGNVVVCLVGDVNPAEARRLAEKYFGPIPARPAPPPVAVKEPAQDSARRSSVENENLSLMFIGYKRPDATHRDDLAFDVISLVLAGSRTGMLDRELIRDRKIAVAAPNVPTFPAGKYPNLFATLLAPASGATLEENEKAFKEIIEKIKTTPVDAETLDNIRSRARGGLLRRLESNSGLANLLPIFHAQYGTWQRLFTALDDVEKVTPDDILRAAREYFVDRNLVVTVLGPQVAGGAK
jgi:predicted Zn-dependent peptidase